MQIEQYTPDQREEWNTFVSESNNGTFLFNRDFMEYHADRITDCSLLIRDKDSLIAIIPGARQQNAWISHPGLTYGGLIAKKGLSQLKSLACFELLLEYLRQQAFTTATIKAVPLIFHDAYNQTQEYALFLSGFALYRRDVSSTIFLERKRKIRKGRKAALSKAKKLNISVQQSDQFEQFMSLTRSTLQAKYGRVPTHSYQEIELLAGRFPNNIKLYCARKDNELVSGAIVFVNSRTMHLQYFSSSPEGEKLSAGDLVIDSLLEDCIQDNIEVFNFGISTEEEGKHLNRGLVAYKESFGAVSTTADFYRIDLA